MAAGDEITFGEIRYREPVPLIRPDHDPTRTCLAYGAPRPTDLPVFLDRVPADAIERHALRDTSVELGGILLGKECVDPETQAPFVQISQALEARHYENTQASFTYTHESWEALSREREAKYPDLDIVGWYHTHPDFGVFLSGHDLFLHGHFFGQPLQVAYVIDPIRQTRGFFFRDGEQMQQVRGYYITDRRGDRLALARFVNDLENLPSHEAGSQLSPRLEAELMSTLSRTRTQPGIDRRSSGPLYLGLGLLLGLSLAGLFFWIAILADELRKQGQAIDRLSTLESTRKAPLDDPASLIRKADLDARQQVLESVLSEVKLGGSSESLGKSLIQAQTELDGMKKRLARVDVEHDALARLAEQARDASQRQSAEVAALRERNARLEDESRAAAEVRGRNEAELKGELAEAHQLIDDGATGKLDSRYRTALWAAIAGWSAFALSVLGLVTLIARGPAAQNRNRPGADGGTPERKTVPAPGAPRLDP